jgi:hypothetical protein
MVRRSWEGGHEKGKGSGGCLAICIVIITCLFCLVAKLIEFSSTPLALCRSPSRVTTSCVCPCYNVNSVAPSGNSNADCAYQI